MGKNIKVYIQYPWKTSDSQYYKSLIDNPPLGINYVSESTKVGMITNNTLFKTRGFLKRVLGIFLRKTGISIMNIKETKTKEKYDLIHCAHCLSKNESPWVADFEGAWQMWVMGKQSKWNYKKIKETLLNKNCKKIIAWTETSKKEIISQFPEIEKKVCIVSYAMPYKEKRKNKKNNKITLLYVSRYFYNKGGLHALEVFDILTKKYNNVEAIFISSTPKKIEKKFKNNEKIKFYDLMPHKKLIEEIFPKTDILIYPGYSDSFGFIFVEALAFGLPVVTVDGFARKNIIDEGKTGYVIKRPKNLSIDKTGNVEKEVIKQIAEKTSLLIENKILREKMSKNCIKTVKNGKFSLKERNKKLKKVYEDAINR